MHIRCRQIHITYLVVNSPAARSPLGNADRQTARGSEKPALHRPRRRVAAPARVARELRLLSGRTRARTLRDQRRRRRLAFVTPLGVAGNGFQDLAYPVWHAFMSGILDTPRLTVSGRVSVLEPFIKTSVASKSLVAEVPIQNSTGAPASGQLIAQVVEDFD